MQKLNFRIPIFNQKVKVRVGKLKKIVKKYKIDIEPPYQAFYYVVGDCHFIALPENYEDYLIHECGHCSWHIVRTIGAEIVHSEEFILYLQEWLVEYIKENL